MRILAICMVCLLAIQWVWCPYGADAATVNYTPSTPTSLGGLQGSVPVNKIGTLLLADAVAILNGNNIEVRGKEKGDTEERRLLAGVLLNPVVARGKLTSICYIREGQDKIGVPGPEKIKLSDGSSCQGQITSVGSGQVTIKTSSGERQISTSEIESIDSPFAYQMSARVTGSGGQYEVARLDFSPTTVSAPYKVAEAPKTKSGPPTSGTTGYFDDHKGPIVFGLGAVAAAVACGVAIPLAVRRRHHHRHDHVDPYAMLLLQSRSGW